ncbi:MAG: hypothetical protein MK066_06385 [Crocinitomicaceae bacterium]|nr:hypothetical protein [Crocinitomicaceae bacterium]
MNLETIYLSAESPFSNHIREWATRMGVEVNAYTDKQGEEGTPDGLLLINENQDIRKDIDEIHTLFDRKHIPTQKIDINGTLQVAVNSFKMWMGSNKCKNILFLGADDIVKNENLERFLSRIES